jgi:hypothetical protein
VGSGVDVPGEPDFVPVPAGVGVDDPDIPF